mmetsp:Transcript_53518/g.135767  ORF Transcript_53518/g.135767 Transcript_53518/m.135767 type:complete len:217 (+) Transcript_53518:185-835(+)
MPCSRLRHRRPMSVSWSWSDASSMTLCGAHCARLIKDSIAAMRTSDVLSHNIWASSAAAFASPHNASSAKVAHALTLASAAEAESCAPSRVSTAAAVATSVASLTTSETLSSLSQGYTTTCVTMLPSNRSMTSRATCHGVGAAVAMATVADALLAGAAGIVGRRFVLLETMEGSTAARSTAAGAVTRRAALRATRGATEETLIAHRPRNCDALVGQ